MEKLFRALFLGLSRSGWLRRMVNQIPIAYRIARRFTAGRSVSEVIAAIRDLRAAGMLCTVDILGEDATSEEIAVRAGNAYISLLGEIETAEVESDISLKLTQLGLDHGLDFCVQNVRPVVARAAELGVFVCIDMEDSARTDQTLEVWRRLHSQYENVGTVLQTYLYRSMDDLQALCAEGATVRLCKGAYKEPASVAFPKKADVDANTVRMMQLMLDACTSPSGDCRPYMAMATHDEKIIAATTQYAEELDLPRDAFEFQLLYGIRRDLQARLAAEGYRMRVYVPFGTEWYSYFMRRMAEWPANVWWVLKGVLKESPGIRNVWR